MTMKAIKILTVGLIVALLAVTGSFAGTDMNEVGALLVYPMVAAFELDKADLDPTNVDEQRHPDDPDHHERRW